MCTTIVVGKNRSANGSFMLAHSEELGRNSAHKVAVSPAFDAAKEPSLALYSDGNLPRTGRCARYLCTKVFDKNHYPGEHTSGVNEHGVAVANNMALMRGIPEDRAYDKIPGGLIWTEFMQAVLESATCAREGAALVGKLCADYGLSCDSGTMIAVVDPNEAWWVELARDGQWVAQQVGPDEVVVRANCYRIGAAKNPGGDTLMASRTLRSHAKGKGWCGSEPLDFAKVYGDPANQDDAYNLDRHTILEARFARRDKIGADDLMAALRDIYEGSELYQTRPDGSPFRTPVRTIARMNTEASTVIELRPELPPGIGHRLWCSLSTSLTGTYVPFHLGIEAIESHYATAGPTYDPASAYWLFTELAKLADYGYTRCIDEIRNTWTPFERDTFAALEKAETEVRGLPYKQAMAALEAFDQTRATEAIQTLEQLLVRVKTLVFHEAF
jgi:dipeptidase